MNIPQRQTNDMSDDSREGGRKSDGPAQAGAPTLPERPPHHDGEDRSNTELFDEEGAGIAAKE